MLVIKLFRLIIRLPFSKFPYFSSWSYFTDLHSISYPKLLPLLPWNFQSSFCLIRPPPSHQYDLEKNQLLESWLFSLRQIFHFWIFCLMNFFVLEKNRLRQKYRLRQKNCLYRPVFRFYGLLGFATWFLICDFIELLEFALK